MIPTSSTLLPVIAAAVAQATDAVVITDALLDEPGPRIVYVNPAFCAMTGYSAEEMLGRSPRMLQGPATDRSELDRVRDALEQGRSYRGETINYHKDGQAYHLRWHMDPLRDGNGTITHWVAIQRDVTPEHTDASERRRLLAAAQSALALRDQFLAVAAHELRTPLTAVLGYASLLRDRLERSSDDHEAQRLSSLTVSQTLRLNALLSQLLDMSRLAQGQFDVEQREIDLADVVTQTVDEARLSAPELGPRLSVKTPPAPVPVSGDPARLSEVLHNLVNNAVKYSAADTPIIVSLGREDGTVVLAVADRGIGIPEAARERLFTPYYRAENVGADTKGFGIGLFVANEIVSRHGGRIDVASEQGRGSTFRVILPLAGHTL